MAYTNFREVEKKWIKYWDENKTFHTETQLLCFGFVPLSLRLGSARRASRRLHRNRYSGKNEKNAGI